MSVKLTNAQAAALVAVKRAGPKGSLKLPTATLAALERKGFIASAPTSSPVGRTYTITDKGKDFLA